MIKRKFGDSLRSKTGTAMVNEALCKILCHNLVVLIHEMFKLRIEPMFLPNETVTAQRCSCAIISLVQECERFIA